MRGIFCVLLPSYPMPQRSETPADADSSFERSLFPQYLNSWIGATSCPRRDTGAFGPDIWSNLGFCQNTPSKLFIGERDIDSEYATCEHYMDDDIGGANTFNNLLRFLHERYFVRVDWAHMTLTPRKCFFAVLEITVLGINKSQKGIRPSKDKIDTIRQIPPPQNEQELDKFLHILPFLKSLIPGRADRSTVMKLAVLKKWEL